LKPPGAYESGRRDCRRVLGAPRELVRVPALSEADHLLLTEFARDLPVLERVRIYPEDGFEARLLLGSGARDAMVREAPAEYGVRSRYLFETVDVTRARRHIERLQRVYAGRCQICLFDPRDRYGRNLCHGHHIQWLSRGGDDAPENLVLICPNHHAAVHQDDAVFEFADLSFRFSNGLVEPRTLFYCIARASSSVRWISATRVRNSFIPGATSTFAIAIPRSRVFTALPS
jgi:hypothetical protein